MSGFKRVVSGKYILQCYRMIHNVVGCYHPFPSLITPPNIKLNLCLNF